jgi:hypothetical protein
MTEDLATKFAVLTEARPEPPDPAAQVWRRIKQRQRRRRGTAAILLTTAAVAVAATAGPALGALRDRGSEPGVSGFTAPTTTATPTPSPTAVPTPSTAAPTSGDHKEILPQPWSDKAFTKLPEANAYRPKAYYVAKGQLSTESWAALAFSGACMVVEEGAANSFGRPYVCFTDWPAGQRANFTVVQGHAKEKNAAKIDVTLVMGAVSVDARKVRIIAGGKTYMTDAVGTPTSDKLRFFALMIPYRDVVVSSVTPLDTAGRPAPAPVSPPTSTPCATNCATATPAKQGPS